MKYKPKGRKAVVITVIVVVILAAAASWSGFASTRSALRVGYVGQQGWDSWWGRYMLLSGAMEKSLHPDGALHVEVSTESGNISIEIRDGDGNVIFDEDKMGTASYDVEASGRVSVRIEADRHKGSFSIHP